MIGSGYEVLYKIVHKRDEAVVAAEPTDKYFHVTAAGGQVAHRELLAVDTVGYAVRRDPVAVLVGCDAADQMYRIILWYRHLKLSRVNVIHKIVL